MELIVQRDAVARPSALPQPREHHDLLGVDVRAREAERLDVELVELAVAALLRALVRNIGPAVHTRCGPL